MTSLHPTRFGLYPTARACVLGLAFALLATCTESNNPQAAPLSTAATTSSLSARIQTDRGDIVVDLETKLTPVLSANFANLVERGFFDGLTIYRSSTVMRQTGNPYNTETRYYNPGYRLLPELAPELTFKQGGMLAMLLWSDDNLADLRQTEFFITVKPQDRWTFKYSIFGSVREGADVVLALQDGDIIRSIRLQGDPTALFAANAENIKAWNASLDENPPDR